MSGMTVVMHREIPAGEDFRQQWNRLVKAMEQPEVFYTWEWAAAVARVYGESRRPLVFAAYREERLAGIAALAVDAGGEVCFLTASTADYCDLVSAPADREELIGLVMRELRGMEITGIQLANLPADSASAPVLRRVLRRSGYSVFARPAYCCAQVPLNSPEVKQQVAKSARRSANKARNALARMGQVAVDHKKRGEEFDAEFPEFARAHVARFLVTGRLSNLLRRERRAFMAELGRVLSAQGWLTLSTLTVDRRTIAWHCGFQFAGTWFSYLPTFDTEVRNLHPGPGAYLLCQILQEAAQAPEIRLVDLGLGEEGYKQQYAKTGRQTLYVTASRSRARVSWQFCRYRAASLVKRSPVFERVVRNGVARISALRAGGIWGQLRNAGLQMGRSFSRQAGVPFLEWAGPGVGRVEDLRLQPLSAKLLADAAMTCEDEDDTLQYLLRSAQRLQSAESEGFALMTGDGKPVHFCWVAPFEGFKIPELGQALKAPSAGAVVIFDGWTPGSERGRRYSAQCAALVADVMAEKGKRPWIFGGVPDSTAELEQAGFVPRFSLVRKRKLFFSRVAQFEFTDSRRPLMDLNPAA